MKNEMTLAFLNQEFKKFKLLLSFYVHTLTIVPDALECNSRIYNSRIPEFVIPGFF